MSKLRFGAGEPSGFTGTHTAMFNDLRPARVVRELLQNSLDAAVESGEDTAIVRFAVTCIDASDVPDLAGYKRAFEEAVEHNKRTGQGLSDASREVIDTIRRALSALEDSSHNLLCVTDNGVGLDERRMTALLGDGASAKPGDASGSYGVGHFAAVPASDLRYLLYGGVQDSGTKIAAGFTILAGRGGPRRPVSSKGYLVKKLLGGANGKLFEFVDGGAMPHLIKDTLKRIRKQWRHGSAVLIPTFNYFGYSERRDVWLSEVVARVAAYNFSAAIYAGELVVEIDEQELDGGRAFRVDRGTLGEVLDRDARRRRAFRRDTVYEGLRPSGQQAWATYRTLAEGTHATVSTMFGPAEIHWLTPAPGGSTHVDLFRNGMWITDSVPQLRAADFADRQPFHMVVQPKRGSILHRLVRKAEGTMHDRLALTLLDDAEREQLVEALEFIAVWIKSNVPAITADQYTPDDFLLFASDAEGAGSDARQFSMWGTPVVVQTARLSQRQPHPGTGLRVDVEPDVRRPNASGKQRKPVRKSGITRSRPLPFRSTVVPDKPGRYQIELECDEAFDDVLLYVRVDENADATCDRVWSDEDVLLKSFKFAKGDSDSAAASLETNTVLRLKGLAAKTTYKLSVSCELPRGLTEAVGTPVLRVDIHKPPLDGARETDGD